MNDNNADKTEKARKNKNAMPCVVPACSSVGFITETSCKLP